MNKKGFLLLLVVVLISAIYLIFFTPSKNEFKEGDLYDEIIQRGKIRIGINTDSKPFGFVNKDGQIDGYDAELAHYIAQYLLKDRERLEFIHVTPSNRLLKASTGEVDIVISTVTITPLRQEVVSFSKPYDNAGQAVLVKTNSYIKSLADASGQSIGIVFGTTAEKNMKVLLPTANIIGFRTYQDAYNALKAGKVVAVTSDDTILSKYTREDSSVKLLPKRYSKEPYGIAFKKGKNTDKLKENLDFAITDLQRKNVINRLHKKWIED